MTSNELRRLNALNSALCDGVIEPHERAELEQMLRASAECRSVYLQYVDMHARLTVHPHLATGIPLVSEITESVATAHDEVVLKQARAMLNTDLRLAREDQVEKRKSTLTGWAVVATVASIALFVTAWYAPWSGTRKLPIIRDFVGQATVELAGASRPVAIGYQLLPGERLRTGIDDARLILEYADGTKVVVLFDSMVEVPEQERDVHLRLVSGAMEVDAAPQLPQAPLIFATDHARYVVVGTRFRLYRETAASRLELNEGKVRMERPSDGKSVEVEAGYVAITADNEAPLDVKPLTVVEGKLVTKLPKAGQAVAFSADGSELATADWSKGFKTWKVGATTPAEVYQGKVGRACGLAFPSDTLIQANSRESKPQLLNLWIPGEKEPRLIPLSEHNVRSRAISPDGLHLIESDDNGTRVQRLDLSAARQTPITTLPKNGKAWCLALSQSAQFAAIGVWDGTVRVYDIRSNEADDLNPTQILSRLVFEKRLQHTPTQLALSPDGSRLAVFTREDGLLWFDIASAQQHLLWAPGGASATCVKFTPDGAMLLAGLGDGTARLWTLHDNHALIVIDTERAPQDIAWSPQRSLLAVANGDVKLWECKLP